jgi:hypothetical protein
MKFLRPQMTADELENLIAGRIGVHPVQVVVRGLPPDWTASLIAKRVGNTDLHGEFSLLVSKLQRLFALKSKDRRLDTARQSVVG